MIFAQVSRTGKSGLFKFKILFSLVRKVFGDIRKMSESSSSSVGGGRYKTSKSKQRGFQKTVFQGIIKKNKTQYINKNINV